MNTLKIGIVGSRRRDRPEDKELIRQAMSHLINKDKNVIISLVSGGCKTGADHFAEELSNELRLSISIHYPDRSKMKDDSKYEYVKQLFARNTLIANEADILLACWDGKSSGTLDTINKSRQLGKQVVLL